MTASGPLEVEFSFSTDFVNLSCLFEFGTSSGVCVVSMGLCGLVRAVVGPLWASGVIFGALSGSCGPWASVVTFSYIFGPLWEFRAFTGPLLAITVFATAPVDS